MTTCRQVNLILNRESDLDALPLESILEAIPCVDELPNDLAIETVLIRADLDMPLKNGRVADHSRLESTLPTIRYCQARGWKVVLLGHVGRDPQQTAEPIAQAFSEALRQEVTFIEDWIDEKGASVLKSAVELVRNATPGSLVVLQNTRKYSVETALWSMSECPPDLCHALHELAMQLGGSISSVIINEGIAASNLDFSSVVLPLCMKHTAMGFFLASEMKEHMTSARLAEVLIMSGLKADKLDDLEGILSRGVVKMLFLAGSLAMAFVKARSLLAGNEVSIGRAETDPEYIAYIGPDRIEQAKRILQSCQSSNIEIILPVDFTLENASTVSEIPEGHAQVDVGPLTSAHFKARLFDWAQENSEAQKTIFYNGVFGKFEDPRFSRGTEEMIEALVAITEMGVRTYVGGGEGRMALLRYASEDSVTHAFTAGGTVLKSLSDRHIGYLKAMYLQNRKPFSA